LLFISGYYIFNQRKINFHLPDFGSINDFKGMYPFRKMKSQYAGHAEISNVMIDGRNTQCSLALGKSKRNYVGSYSAHLTDKERDHGAVWAL
jgi:hypothetical protein